MTEERQKWRMRWSRRRTERIEKPVTEPELSQDVVMSAHTKSSQHVGRKNGSYSHGDTHIHTIHTSSILLFLFGCVFIFPRFFFCHSLWFCFFCFSSSCVSVISQALFFPLSSFTAQFPSSHHSFFFLLYFSLNFLINSSLFLSGECCSPSRLTAEEAESRLMLFLKLH